MSNHTPEGRRPCHDGSGRTERGSGGFGPNWRTTPASQSSDRQAGGGTHGLRPPGRIEMSIGSARAAARRRLTTSTSTWSTTRSICQRVPVPSRDGRSGNGPEERQSPAERRTHGTLSARSRRSGVGSSSKRSTWDCTGSSSTGWTRPSRPVSPSATCGIRPGAIPSHSSRGAFAAPVQATQPGCGA